MWVCVQGCWIYKMSQVWSSVSLLSFHSMSQIKAKKDWSNSFLNFAKTLENYETLFLPILMQIKLHQLYISFMREWDEDDETYAHQTDSLPMDGNLETLHGDCNLFNV
jgi:hypothetical protein